MISRIYNFQNKSLKTITKRQQQQQQQQQHNHHYNKLKEFKKLKKLIINRKQNKTQQNRKH